VEVRIIKECKFEVGEVVNLPDFQAKELIEKGYAVLALVRSFIVENGKSKHKSEKTVTL
jgi:hypothetical protein